MLTCKEATPWLQFTGIKGITLWPHLEYDGIDPIFSQLVKLVCQCLLHALGSHSQELSIDALYPCASELTLHLGANSAYDHQKEG